MLMQEHKLKKRHAVINLVAMIDMLTVLVFFLLVYSTEQVEVVPDPEEAQLPNSIAEVEVRHAVVVIVGENNIIVHGKPIASIDAILASNTTIIEPLFVELEADDTDMLRLMALPEEERIAAREVTIMADRELPFKLVRNVMATATAAGYGKLSLAVMQKPSDLAIASVASNN
jgi:biopolymer transport protein ExbD